MHVPKAFWTDAIFYACHLINRMSSSMLHDKILFFCLYPDKPTFYVVLRVFGSTYFIQNLQPGQDKLERRTIKCVLLAILILEKITDVLIQSIASSILHRM